MKIVGFHILDKLGEGGMATVWLAKQLSLDRLVALKILKPNLAAKPDEVTSFINEARAAAKIKHTNIIQIFDVAEQNGMYYFAMEYINGETVQEMLKRKGKLTQKRALKIALCTADALESSWNQAHIIHRDVKPDNIMIDEDGAIKLADLGLAKSLDPSILQAQLNEGYIEGSPYYIAPEQAMCYVDIDFRTDMYSLGASLYHMVTGELPFGDDDQMTALEKHMSGQLVNPRDISPSTVSIGVAQLITRLMMKDPDDRYDSWPEAIAEIKKVMAGRILLGKQNEDDASTIAPASQKGSGAKKGKYKRSIIATKKNPVPLGLRISAWLLLIVWWAVLAALRMPEKQASTYRPNYSALPGSTHSKPPESSTGTQPAPQLPELNPIPPEVAAVEPPPEVTPEPEDTPPPEVTPAPEIADLADLNTMRANIVGLISNGQISMAIAVVKNELEYDHSDQFVETMSEITDFLTKVKSENVLFAAALKKRVGRRTTITFNNRKKSVKIEKVNADSVVVSLEVRKGETTTTVHKPLLLNQFHPLEKSRWIGTATRPEVHIIKYFLHMRAKDYQTAKKHADKCGPLTGTIAEILKPHL